MAVDVTRFSEGIVAQWEDASRLRAVIDGVLEIIQDEIVDVADELQDCLNIGIASNDWLNRIGARVGVARPAVVTSDDVLRFDGDDGAGFDNFPWHDESILAARQPLGDVGYRKLLRARVATLTRGVSKVDYEAALTHIDSAATVTDNNDMTYDVSTTESSLFALAEALGCLPAPVGVRRT